MMIFNMITVESVKFSKNNIIVNKKNFDLILSNNHSVIDFPFTLQDRPELLTESDWWKENRRKREQTPTEKVPSQ